VKTIQLKRKYPSNMAEKKKLFLILLLTLLLLCLVYVIFDFLDNTESYFDLPFKQYSNPEMGFKMDIPDPFTVNYDSILKKVTFEAPDGSDYFKRKSNFLGMVIIDWDNPLTIIIVMKDSMPPDFSITDTLQVDSKHMLLS